MCAAASRIALLCFPKLRNLRLQSALPSPSASYFCSFPVSSHSIDFPNSRLIFSRISAPISVLPVPHKRRALPHEKCFATPRRWLVSSGLMVDYSRLEKVTVRVSASCVGVR